MSFAVYIQRSYNATMHIHATAKEPVGMLFTKCETTRDGFVCCDGTILGDGFRNERDQSYHIFNPRCIEHHPSFLNTLPNPYVCEGNSYPACHWSLLHLTGCTYSKPLEDYPFVSLSLIIMTEAMRGVMMMEMLSRCMYLTATVLA